MKITLILAALLSAAACAQTTVTAPSNATPSVAAPPVATPPDAPPPAVTAPEPGTFWVYYKGKFNWGGDYDFGSGKVDLYNRDPNALSGTRDVLVSGDVGWQPYAPNWDFNTTGYNYLTVSIKPTEPGNTWVTGGELAGDKEIPGSHGAFSIMPTVRILRL